MIAEPKQYEIDTARLSSHVASLLTELNKFYQDLHMFVIEQEAHKIAGVYPQEFYDKIKTLFAKIQPLIEQNSALGLSEVIGTREVTGTEYAQQQAEEQAEGLKYITVLLKDIAQQLKPGLDAETIPTEDPELLPLRELLEETIESREEYLRSNQAEVKAWSPGGAKHEEEQEYRRQQEAAVNERTNRMMGRFRQNR